MDARRSTKKSLVLRDGRQWRCDTCSAILGVFVGDKLQVRSSRAPEYLCSLPVSARCNRCNALNETPPPSTMLDR
jgi:hypothetical protein